MKRTLFSGKSTRTKIYTAITLVGICLLLCLNLGLSYLFSRHLLVTDLTPEEFYTLSDTMEEVCHELLDPDENGNAKEIKITFCTDPDYLIGNDKYRATYFMALNLQRKFKNVTVKTVNVSLNPTAVSMYRTTSRDTISASDMIVSYGAKYRIADITGFWTVDSETEETFSYNGEYRMASILASLTAIDQPVAYFSTDHGETYYDPANPDSENSKAMGTLADLLTERGLKIATIDISKADRIPDDCVLLIINDPKIDFSYDDSRLDEFSYVSDTEKLDRYLVKDYGSIIVNKSHEIDLPVLEGFLSEWGIAFGDEQVYDPDNSLFFSADSEPDGSVFTGVYDADEENFGSAYYGSYASLTSAPKMVFKNTGYLYCSFDNGDVLYEHGNKQGTRNYTPFIGTSVNAYNYIGDTTITDTGEKALVAAGVRSNLDAVTAERVYSYLFCTNSSDFFSNELLGNPSYANYDVMASVISNISRTDKYATTDLGGLTSNSASVGGKRCVSTELSNSPIDILSADLKEIIDTKKGISNGEIIAFTVMVMLVPVAILSVGIVVFIKRKFL